MKKQRKILNKEFVNVELGLLKEFLHKGLSDAAIKQIDSDIEKLISNIKTLQSIKENLESEQVEDSRDIQEND